MSKQSITRRRFVQTAIGSLAAVACRTSKPAQPRARQARPNIVFIMADDLGYADLSSYGRREYTTPNIDRLATEGLKLSHAYSNSALCSPTRTALITGRYQYRFELGLEEPVTEESPKTAGLPLQHPTLPSQLKKLGYETNLVGKWHLGFPPTFGPRKSGYDHFFGIQGGAADYFEHGPSSRAPLYEDEVTVDRHGYMTELLGDRAVQSSNVTQTRRSHSC
jgi:arylsulfatase A-like enzyme